MIPPNSQSPPSHSVSSHTSEMFYVGYLPLPRAVGSFLRVAVPTVLWIMVALAAATSVSQPDPGAAVWSDGHVQTFRGTLVLWPYPMILTDADADHPGQFWLLVEVGKRGVSRDLAKLQDTRVQVTGWTLDRDGRRIIELEPGEDSIQRLPEAPVSPNPPHIRAVGGVTLRGEIVDSKCYLGAMKPGEGKTHKACATLCIRGGIPPMLVSPTPSGRREYTILCDSLGAPLPADFWGYIADPVLVTGDLELRGDLRRLRVHPAGIVRC